MSQPPAQAPGEALEAPAHRDHREIAREMGIFASDALVGSGLPLWLPDGAVIRAELEAYAREVAVASGCQPVYSPVLGKRALYERSGHWAKFHDDMFPPMDVGGEEFVLRPANCPHHALMYASAQRSYRELPIRYNELGAMFRSERSGVLSGLSRVRQINLDDTHVFCRPDQIGAEAAAGLAAILEVMAVLGLPIDHIRLSKRDDSAGFLGDLRQWADAEEQLRQVLRDLDGDAVSVPWREAEGEAAFYGPKLDVQMLDPQGHEESVATVQIDFNQPERFDLRYVDASGERQRVVMIHRGVLGAMERLVAFLLEAHDGRLPLWLAPVQLRILPVGEDHWDYADDLAGRASARGLRAAVEAQGSLGARIRAAHERRDAVIAVVGEAERQADAVSVTDPAAGFRGRLPIDDCLELLAASRAQRLPRVPWPAGQ